MLHYFMRLHEFKVVVDEILGLGLTVVVNLYNRRVVASSSEAAMSLYAERQRPRPNRQFYVGEEKPPWEIETGSFFQPARWGLVLLEAPSEDGRRLYLGACGYKSTWVDEEQKLQYTSPVPRRVYRRVEKVLRKRLTFPAWITWATGEGARPCDDRGCPAGFSAGAEAWFREGGEWMQEGAEGTRYAPHDPR